MLIALLILSLLGAGAYEIFSTDEFGYVEEVIEEPARADRAMMIMRRVNRLGAQLSERREDVVAELATLNADQSIGAEDYQAVLDRLWRARSDVFDLYMTDVFQLREQMTRDEWKAAFAARVGQR
jgi:type II secretory pathway component PulJ